MSKVKTVNKRVRVNLTLSKQLPKKTPLARALDGISTLSLPKKSPQKYMYLFLFVPNADKYCGGAIGIAAVNKKEAWVCMQECSKNEKFAFSFPDFYSNPEIKFKLAMEPGKAKFMFNNAYIE